MAEDVSYSRPDKQGAIITVHDQKSQFAAESYAQWVARTIRKARSSGSGIVTLFDSSVPEPKELLRQVIVEGFGEAITPRYVTTFGGGNRFVIEILAKRYAVRPADVLCTTGATGAVAMLCRTLLAPGDEALIEAPGFDLFTALAEDSGATTAYFERPAPLFDIDLADIERRLRPNTRLIILSNLHNPSGMPVSHQALKDLAVIAERRGIHVIVDEVYGDYADAATRPCPACAISPAFISVSSFTKIWGLSTLRCGWIVAAPDVMARVRDRSERLEFGLSNLAHATAALVFEHSDRFDSYTQGTVREARPIMQRCFDEWQAEGLVEGILPDFGCIFFPRLIGIDDTAPFSDWLAARASVIVAPGGFFGAPDHIRIGHAQRIEDLERGLLALGQGLRDYRSLSARELAHPSRETDAGQHARAGGVNRHRL